jgi:hypothetical protein
MPPSTDLLALKDLFPSNDIRHAQGDMHASSVSSFHSVSLSDGGDDSAATPGALHAFPMEREWMGMGTETGRKPRWVLRKCLCAFFIPLSSILPTTLTSMSPRKPALVLATKQAPPPPPLPSQPPKLPQHLITHPRCSTNNIVFHSSFP